MPRAFRFGPNNQADNIAPFMVIQFRRCGRAFAFAVAACACAFLPANAQDFTKVLTEVQNVSIFGRYGGFLPKSRDLQSAGDGQSGLYGYGIELSYDVPERAGSMFWFSAGLGYSQLAGFRASSDSFDFRGSIRDLPSVTFYAGASPSSKFWVPDPYLGFTTGLMKLQNADVYKTDGTVVQASSEAFMAGLLGGLGFGSKTFSPFVELGYRVRYFPSIDYKELGPTTKAPAWLPRALSFSGWSLDIGMQINIKDPTPPKAATEPQKTPRDR